MRWSGGCGLATCHVIIILDIRQLYADGIPLAERMEDLAAGKPNRAVRRS